ncbi:MAG: hypothetical protein WC725_02195 [Patescibacteria group bacterium]|jgi:hypothetical protein
MLEHFFGSKTRLKLLKVFFRSPDRSFYVRELARLIKTQLNAVRREISNLQKLRIIRTSIAGDSQGEEAGTERSKYYQVDELSPLFAELRALLTKSEVLEEQELVEEIKHKGGKIKLFLLTGVFTGEKDATTDIMIVGKLKPLIVSKIIRRYEDDLGKTIRYTFMTEEEFKDRRHIGDRFLFAILEAKHVFVVNELEVS